MKFQEYTRKLDNLYRVLLELLKSRRPVLRTFPHHHEAELREILAPSDLALQQEIVPEAPGIDRSVLETDLVDLGFLDIVVYPATGIARLYPESWEIVPLILDTVPEVLDTELYQALDNAQMDLVVLGTVLVEQETDHWVAGILGIVPLEVERGSMVLKTRDTFRDLQDVNLIKVILFVKQKCLH